MMNFSIDFVPSSFAFKMSLDKVSLATIPVDVHTRGDSLKGSMKASVKISTIVHTSLSSLSSREGVKYGCLYIANAKTRRDKGNPVCPVTEINPP